MGFINVLQVVGAKVVTNAKSPGARCYGFVTMSSTEEATKCISHLHRTELHGRMISVERVSVGRRTADFSIYSTVTNISSDSLIIWKQQSVFCFVVLQCLKLC